MLILIKSMPLLNQKYAFTQSKVCLYSIKSMPLPFQTPCGSKCQRVPKKVFKKIYKNILKSSGGIPEQSSNSKLHYSNCFIDIEPLNP